MKLNMSNIFSLSKTTTLFVFFIYERCFKRIASFAVFDIHVPVKTKPLRTYIALFNTITMVCTCAHKSNGKIDNLSFE